MNYIRDCLLNFGYVILTSLPYYLFFIIMYSVLKKTSPNGNIAKRFYKNKSSKKENKLLNTLEFIMNYICKNALIFSFIIFIVIILSVLFYGLDNNKPINAYMTSAEALRLQKYLCENLLTIVIAVVSSVAIFSSLDKKYYLIFSSKDIIKALNIKEDIITILLLYFMCIISTSIYYIFYYIDIDIKESIFVKVFLFCLTMVSSITIVIWIFKLFYSTMKFLFSDKTEYKLLDSLHNNIWVEKSPDIYLSSEYKSKIKFNMDYLLSKFDNQFKISNEKILFIDFLKEYDNFDKKIKQKIFNKSYIVAIAFNLFFAFLIKTYFDLKMFRIFIMAVSIILNLLICLVLYKTDFKNIFIHIQIWCWGFLIKKDNIKYYVSISKNNITNKKYGEYFKNLFNIVCLFKRILLSNKKCARYCLNNIIDYISNNHFDYILYAVCLYLYCNKYGKDKTQLLKLKEFIMQNDIKWDILELNLIALINYIYRCDSNKEVEEFICSIKNADKIISIKLNKSFKSFDKNSFAR